MSTPPTISECVAAIGAAVDRLTAADSTFHQALEAHAAADVAMKSAMAAVAATYPPMLAAAQEHFNALAALNAARQAATAAQVVTPGLQH